jgi:hypothetical protein
LLVTPSRNKTQNTQMKRVYLRALSRLQNPSTT